MSALRRQKQTMPKEIRHLRAEDRKALARLIKEKKSQTDIARWLGFSQGTISKELKRNRGRRGYRPLQAQRKAHQRQLDKPRRKSVITEELAPQIITRIESKHSPQQISHGLALTGQIVSTSTIYHHVYRDKKVGGHLHQQLRINGRRRYRHRNKASRVKIPNRKDISLRPSVVASRERYGDWEVDLIEGTKGSGYLLSLYERKSRFGKIIKLKTKTSAETSRAIIKQLKKYRVTSITYDNGLEFAKHEAISKALATEGYFCTPYASWEKGGVENFNGLVRQYFPKGTSFHDISPSHLQKVETEINNRPRKVLGYLSPAQLHDKIAA